MIKKLKFFAVLVLIYYSSILNASQNTQLSNSNKFYNLFNQITTNLNLYIANFGNDNNPGTIELPFKSLEKAVDVVQKADGQYFSIFLRKGLYQINKSINISLLNNKHLIISNYQNEKVEIIGGIKLDNNKFHKVIDETIKGRLSKKSLNNIYETNLKEQGINDFGTIKKYYTYSSFPTSLELFSNDVPLTLAGWPNSSLLSVEKVLQRGAWKDSLNPIFNYTGNRPETWVSTNDKFVWGHFAEEWTYECLPIDKFDFNKKNIYLKDKTSNASSGIFSSTDVSTGNIANGRSVRGYYYFNILEELDTVGEWYLNRSDANLYLWPNSS